MTNPIPDGISFSDLEKLAKDAPAEQDTRSFQERCSEVADRLLDQATDEIKDPMVHKAIFLEICRRMISWHTAIGEEMFERGEHRSGTCWLRDAGKFQSAAVIVQDVCIGPDDWTCEE